MQKQTTFNEFDDDGGRTLRMDKEGYREWVEQFDFTFAKKSASRGAPHEYIILYDDLPSDRSENRTFFEFVIFIRVNGYDKEFMNRTYRVCEVGDYLYWNNGNPVGETFILNRKPIGGYDEYDEAEMPTDGFQEV